MSDRQMLVRLSKAVKTEMEAGPPGDAAWDATQFLTGQPQAILPLIDLIFDEGNKDRSDDGLVSAYLYLFGFGLETVRQKSEARQREADALLDSVRVAVAERGERPETDPGTMLLVLSRFIGARLDPGDGLRDLMAGMAGEMDGFGDVPGLDGGDPASFLDDLLAMSDGDPFILFEQVRQMALTLPEDHRIELGQVLFHADAPVVREAALGWFLDPAPAVRDAAAAAVADGPVVSGVTLRRMIALRSWLPEPARAPLDRAIQASRRRGVDCAPWPKGDLREAHATFIDGAGAQTLILVSASKRRSVLGNVLLKDGVGVCEVFSRPGMTKAETRHFLAMVGSVMDLMPVTPAFVEEVLRHSLAVGVDQGMPPPFGLLDLLETAGLPPPTPAWKTATALLDALPAAAGEAPWASTVYDDWIIAESWFENGDDVTSLLKAAGKRPNRARLAALVLESGLPPHREEWADRLAWVAATLHSSTDKGRKAQGVALAGIVRGVADPAVPLDSIPLMQHIAAQTVEAFLADKALKGRG